MTWQVASPGPWCQWRTGRPCSTPSMTWHIQAYVPQDGCCLHVLSGKAWAKTWQPCAARASSVRVARCTSSQQLQCRPFPCRHASSPTCTWTWLDLYQFLQRGTCTCSPSSTGLPGGSPLGSPLEEHGGQHVRGCLHLQLGGTFWRAGDCDHRQRHTVHVCLVVFYLHEPGHQARAYHCLPPTKQWHAGACAQAAQGCPTCTWCGSCVALPSSMGVDGPTCST